ncbi:response regulator [Peribacillus cavernae]|uniref:Response regulator n=1 Tax=Peribacillus cavernae TaxID=1674310 RepID=A0A433HWL1_9BACI|nr:response regulator [Peribacillus cavernae]MDQ0218127.1 two-component system response regulator YesN [Peribacillus cavernae]RUQ32719.1 response regulator [Peribacillus cavernae]
MNVMIADDEMLERKAMKKFLEENFDNIKVIGEASNGREAIELAEQLQPDFIVMDIKMPGINGVEAIKQIRKKQTNIKFIMVSAYDSFAYAKEAMKEGVKEYILKPARKEETLQAIVRVCEEINNEKAASDQQKESLYLAKENFLLKILQYDVSGELLKQQKQLYPEMKSGFFFVADIEESQDGIRLLELLHQHSPFPYTTVHYGNHYVTLFIYPKEQPKLDALVLAKKIIAASSSGITIGIGYPYSNVRQLPKSYQEALQTLRALKKDNRTLYSLPFVKKEESLEEYEELFIYLYQGSFPSAWPMAELLLSKMEQPELYIRIRERLVREALPIDDLSIPQTQTEWKEFIQTLCLKALDYHHSKNPIEKAKKYIDLHYREPITLEQVAEHVKLSPTYFTKLFRESAQMTFIDYLTETRLAQAKQLLSENTYSLKEISYMIGYKDPNYFSRVFKRNYQMSPKQFKKQRFGD